MDIKIEVKEEPQEMEVVPDDTNGSVPSSSSSQRNTQNGINGLEYKYPPRLQEGELMEVDPTPAEEVRPMTPPLGERRSRSRSGERSRSRSRSRERSRSAQLQNDLDQILRDDTKVQKTEKSKTDAHQHYIYHVNNLVAADLSKSALLKIGKIFGCVRYAIEAFENGHHVFYASDNYEERRAISDYVLKRTLAEYLLAPRIFIIGRNESIVHERHNELAQSPHYCNAYIIPSDFDSLQHHRCYLSTIKTFRTFYLKFPGFFNKDDVFIFEDFQYIGDPNVGHLYEEALLIPPSNGHFVFLTPHIANADELSRWISGNDGNARPLDCITVLKRNFILQHFITRQYERTMGQVVDENGEFQESNFVEATAVTNKVPKFSETKKAIDRQPLICKLARTVLFRVPPPVLIYSFDTEDIENTVNLLHQFSFNSEPDQLMIENLFNNELKQLSKDDSEHPEILNLLPFLQRGIAPFHYGMFPFIRKIVNFFFARGFIKVIVADNVILNETNFHFHSAIILRDRLMVELGQYRWIKPSEYNVICERIAGKTLSSAQVPLVILVNGDEDMPIDVAKEIFTNNIITLESQLKITPTLILSGIESPILREDDVIKKSFGRRRRIEYAKRIQLEMREKSRQLEELSVDEEESLARYQRQLEDLEELKTNLRLIKFKPTIIKSFMDVGRIVKIFMNGHDFGYGIIVNINPSDSIDVLLNVTKESYEAEDDKALRPAVNGLKNTMMVYHGRLTDVTVVTKLRLALPSSLRGDEERIAVSKFLNKMVENLSGDLPELELGHLNISDQEAINKNETILREERELNDLKRRITNFIENYEKYQEKQKLAKVVDDLEQAYEQAHCKDAEEMQRNIFNLLGPFDYYNDAKENLTARAEFALNLPIKENILLAELFFNGYFNNITTQNTLLILSTFIDMEVTLEKFVLSPEDQKLFDNFKNDKVQKFAHQLRKKEIIKHAEKECMNNFNPTLFDFLYGWWKKFPFNAAMARTDIRSGFIATYLERLHELLVRIIAKSHLIPAHPDNGIIWKDRFIEIDTLLARDIPFIAI